MTIAASPHHETDFAVIGGGVVGASIGWGLARAGHAVTLLDEGDVALRASRGNFALVWVQGKGLGLPAYARWTRRSSDTWQDFAAVLESETGIALHHSRPGGFTLCLSDAELQERADEMRRLHNQFGAEEYPYEFMDQAQTRQHLPAIGPEVAGAIYCPLDGHVNSLKLFRALHVAFQLHGGRYGPGHAVSRIETTGKGVRLVGDWGSLDARRVVLAAGLDNARLAPMVGLRAPVTANRGHVLVTEKAAPFLRYPLVNLRQTDEGGIMIGDSHEDGAGDTRVRIRLVSEIAARAIRQFPVLGNLDIVRSWSALRVMSPDGFPIYEQSATVPDAFVVNCHSGITLAAAHALLLAPAIAGGQFGSGDFQAFSSGRLDVPAAA